MPSAEKIAYSYNRLSTKSQIIGDGFDRQTRTAKDWCDRHGFTLSDLTFNDLGVSGFRGKNIKGTKGAMRKLLECVENGTITPGSTVLIETFDRFSRSKPLIAFDAVVGILKCGVEIVTMWNEERFTKNDEYDKWKQILSALELARMESVNKSKRLKEVWKKRRSLATEGDATHFGRLPKWIGKDRSGNLKLIPSHAAIVRKIFNWYVNDKWSVHAIFKELTANYSERCFNLSGEWTKRYVTRILTSITVTGFTHQYVTKEDQDGNIVREKESENLVKMFPECIPMPVFEAAQKKKSTVSFKGSREDRYVNLFNVSNLICGRCGRPMYAVKGKHRSYKCSGFLKDVCKEKATWNLHEFEKQFLNLCAELKLRDIHNVSTAKKRLQETEATIKNLDRERRRIQKRYDDTVALMIETGQAKSTAMINLLNDTEKTLNSIIEKIEVESRNLKGLQSSPRSAQSFIETLTKKDLSEIGVMGIPNEWRYQLKSAIADQVEMIWMFTARGREDMTSMTDQEWIQFVKDKHLQSKREDGRQRQLRVAYVKFKGSDKVRIIRGVPKLYSSQSHLLNDPRIQLVKPRAKYAYKKTTEDFSEVFDE